MYTLPENHEQTRTRSPEPANSMNMFSGLTGDRMRPYTGAQERLFREPLVVRPAPGGTRPFIKTLANMPRPTAGWLTGGWNVEKK